MNITEADIQKLKQELEDDLRALKRAEQIFLKRQVAVPGSTRSSPGHGGPAHDQLTTESVPKSAADWQLQRKGALLNAVKSLLKAAGPEGLRPKDIVSSLEKAGYPFKNHHVASSIVGSALRRLQIRDGLVEKKAGGEYVWRAIAANSHSR